MSRPQPWRRKPSRCESGVDRAIEFTDSLTLVRGNGEFAYQFPDFVFPEKADDA